MKINRKNEADLINQIPRNSFLKIVAKYFKDSVVYLHAPLLLSLHFRNLIESNNK